MKSTKIFIFLLIIALTFTNCSKKRVQPNPILGNWKLVSMEDTISKLTNLPSTFGATANLKGDSITGIIVNNSYSGLLSLYNLNNILINHIGASLAPDFYTQYEYRYFGLLNLVNTYQLKNDSLILSGKNGNNLKYILQ